MGDLFGIDFFFEQSAFGLDCFDAFLQFDELIFQFAQRTIPQTGSLL